MKKFIQEISLNRTLKTKFISMACDVISCSFCLGIALYVYLAGYSIHTFGGIIFFAYLMIYFSVNIISLAIFYVFW